MRRFSRAIFHVATIVAITAIVVNAETATAGDEQLRIIVEDRDTGEPLVARLHLFNANGKPRPIRGDRLAWGNHLTVDGSTVLKLPIGEYSFIIYHGAEYRTTSGTISMGLAGNDTKTVSMQRAMDVADTGWFSGDLDVRRPVRDMPILLEAEDLRMIAATTFSNDRLPVPPGKLNPEQRRAPDGTISSRGVRFADLGAGRIVRPGAELLVARCGKDAPPMPATDSPWPTYENALEAIHGSGGGSERETRPWIDLASPTAADLPLLVAAGWVDSVRLIDSRYTPTRLVDDEKYCRQRDRDRYPDPLGLARWNLDVYVKLLEAGVFLPPTAGSGSGAAPANSAATGIGSNPPGENRVYVAVDGPFSADAWWESLRLGHAVVTNGPLMIPSVHGMPPGFIFETGGGPQSFPIALSLSLRGGDQVNYIEILKNGRVYHEIPLAEYTESRRLPEVEFDAGEEGWFLIRAVLQGPTDRYRFAMTAPWFVRTGVSGTSESVNLTPSQRPPTGRISRSAAQFFFDWTMERARQLAMHSDPDQRRALLEEYRIARDFWRARVEAATCE